PPLEALAAALGVRRSPGPAGLAAAAGGGTVDEHGAVGSARHRGLRRLGLRGRGPGPDGSGRGGRTLRLVHGALDDDRAATGARRQRGADRELGGEPGARTAARRAAP